MSKRRTAVATPDKTESEKKSAFLLEEENVNLEDSSTDAKKFKDHCDSLKQMCHQIWQSKCNNEKFSTSSAVKHFLSMKELNRHAQFRVKKSRELTAEKKLQIDHQHLQRQNLLYEVIHMEKEINKCLGFRSRDEDIKLIEEGEFYKTAPQEISEPEVTKSDLHKRTLARLTWELEQRKQLSAERTLAKSEIDEVQKSIRSKRDYLESLHPKIKEIIEVTKPVEDAMNLKLYKTEEQNKLAGLLPEPLFILYFQTKSYADSMDSSISVCVRGDLEAARTANQSRDEQRSADAEDNPLDSDSENGENERKRKKHRHRTKSDREKDNNERTFQVHPLVVDVDLLLKSGEKLHLHFSYANFLKIVTLTFTVELSDTLDTSSIIVGDLFSGRSLLDHLYPEDSGSLRSVWLHRHDLRRSDRAAVESRLGGAYVWCQWLAGLSHLGDRKSRPNMETAYLKVEDCLIRVKKRLKNRINLSRQLASIERNKFPINPEYEKKFPSDVGATLTNFRKAAYGDFMVEATSKSLLDEDLVHECDLYYTFSIERGLHQGNVWLVIPIDFPKTGALCTLSVSGETQSGVTKDSINDIQIQILETEVNCFPLEFSTDPASPSSQMSDLLICQIRRLLTAFDIYCQCEMGQTTKTRIINQAKYPSRSCPLKYVSSLGSFVQR